MITRRQFLTLTGGAIVGAAGFGGYAFGYGPMQQPRVARYRVMPDNWPESFPLRIVVLTDIHACEPWMSAERIAGVVASANALQPDITVLLGDFVGGHRFAWGAVAPEVWVEVLSELRAPLGVHAVLGNHDWWDDKTAMAELRGPTFVHRALERVGIPFYENDVIRLEKDNRPFWLAGIGSQLAFIPAFNWGYSKRPGVDDLPGTLAKVTDDAPVILLAHEPDIFPEVPERVALTLCGHTHGGQVRLLGYSPIVPSAFGNRFAYGHIVEENRHMIVSGGLGCSILPVRFGVPPELVVVELGETTG